MLDWIDSGMDEDYQMILDDLEMTVLGTIDLSIQNFTNKKEMIKNLSFLFYCKFYLNKGML